MDEDDDLKAIWLKYFGRDASQFERNLMGRFDETFGMNDPIFPIAMLLTIVLYESLGSSEKAVLERGPLLAQRVELMGTSLDELRRELTQLNRTLTDVHTSSKRVLHYHQELGKKLMLDPRGFMPIFQLKDRPLTAKMIAATVAATLIVVFCASLATASLVRATVATSHEPEKASCSWNASPIRLGNITSAFGS